MYIIENRVSKEIAKFKKVTTAVKYLKELKGDLTPPTSEEIADLCNTFAKFKNNIAINGIPRK